MCSSPKGGTTKPLLSRNVDSLTGDMSASEYSNMVHRANQSYEQRQEELIEYRKTHKNKLSTATKKPVEESFLDKLKALFTQSTQSEHLETKYVDISEKVQ